MTPPHAPHTGLAPARSSVPAGTAAPQLEHQAPSVQYQQGQNGIVAPDCLSISPNVMSAKANVAIHPSEIDTSGRGFGPVLRNSRFLRLWLGQVFSQVADKIYLVLMIALITDRFQAADQTVSGWVSAIMIAFTIPAVLFGSVAGVFVDRWSKQQVLVLTNLVRGGLVLLLPLLLWLCQDQGEMWMDVPFGFGILLGITFLVSTLTQFFAPAEQATIPLVVPQPHLLSANSLYTLTMMLAVIGGFAAGEPLLEFARGLMMALGLHWDIGREWIVGGSYGLAGLILLGLSTGEASHSESTAPHIWADIRDGLHYLQQQPRVRVAVVQLVILSSAFAALAILVVRLAEVLPELKASQFGFLLAAGGVGMACSAGLLGQIGHRFPHYQLSGYGSLGLATMLGGLAFASDSLWLSLALLAGVGVFAAWIGVPMQTTIQEETPEDMRGKVFGLQNNAVNIALSLPLALAGIAETWFGLEQVFLGLAVLVVTGGLLSWYIARTSSSIDDTVRFHSHSS